MPHGFLAASRRRRHQRPISEATFRPRGISVGTTHGTLASAGTELTSGLFSLGSFVCVTNNATRGFHTNMRWMFFQAGQRLRVPIVISIVSDGSADIWLKDLLASGCSFNDRGLPGDFRNVWQHMHSQEHEWPPHRDCTRWLSEQSIRHAHQRQMTVGITTSSHPPLDPTVASSVDLSLCFNSVPQWSM